MVSAADPIPLASSRRPSPDLPLLHAGRLLDTLSIQSVRWLAGPRSSSATRMLWTRLRAFRNPLTFKLFPVFCTLKYRHLFFFLLPSVIKGTGAQEAGPPPNASEP